jgi:glutamate 5-kinase
VSSGAIGFGAAALGLTSRPKKVELRQACAAVGQPILMEHWRRALGRHNVTAAQILLSRETFDDRRSFLNLRNAVENLLAIGAVPIFNENDSVSTTEIGDVFGDNDSLSAHVASKLDAGLLVLLTDIDALYDKDPRIHAEARPVKLVEKITDEVRASAGKAGSTMSTGGMITKIMAVEVAARAGCRTVLADGRVPGMIVKIIDGEEVGTLFLAGSRMGARARWILGARPRGTISVDEGALSALDRRKSLLPSGVTGVDGVFEIGDIVVIESRYQAVTSMGSSEIRQVMGRHTRDVAGILGPGRRNEVAIAEDIVPLNTGSIIIE